MLNLVCFSDFIAIWLTNLIIGDIYVNRLSVIPYRDNLAGFRRKYYAVDSPGFAPFGLNIFVLFHQVFFYLGVFIKQIFEFQISKKSTVSFIQII